MMTPPHYSRVSRNLNMSPPAVRRVYWAPLASLEAGQVVKNTHRYLCRTRTSLLFDLMPKCWVSNTFLPPQLPKRELSLQDRIILNFSSFIWDHSPLWPRDISNRWVSMGVKGREGWCRSRSDNSSRHFFFEKSTEECSRKSLSSLRTRFQTNVYVCVCVGFVCVQLVSGQIADTQNCGCSSWPVY